jgi:hypothetical protein
MNRENQHAEETSPEERESIQRFLFDVILPRLEGKKLEVIEQHLRMGTPIDAAFWLEGVSFEVMKYAYEENQRKKMCLPELPEQGSKQGEKKGVRRHTQESVVYVPPKRGWKIA